MQSQICFEVMSFIVLYIMRGYTILVKTYLFVIELFWVKCMSSFWTCQGVTLRLVSVVVSQEFHSKTMTDHQICLIGMVFMRKERNSFIIKMKPTITFTNTMKPPPIPICFILTCFQWSSLRDKNCMQLQDYIFHMPHLIIAPYNN